MSRVHVAIFDPNPSITVLKEEIYLTFAYWLRQAGHSVSLERGVIDSSKFNVLVGFPYISQDAITELAQCKPGYAIFDVEIVDDAMVNYKPETQRFFVPPFDQLFHRAKAFFSYYEKSLQFIRTYFSIPTFKLLPAYCPVLQTHTADEHSLPDIEVLFFGRVYGVREAMLKEVSKSFITRILDFEKLSTFHFRNELAFRAGVVLHLKHREPFQHIGMMRLLSMAHIGAFSLAEDNVFIEAELRPLSAWWNPGESSLTEMIGYWLQNSEQRKQLALRANEHIRKIHSQTNFATFLSTHCAI